MKMLSCIGDLTVDVIAWPNGKITQEKEQKTKIVKSPGGQATNCARFAAELGMKTSLFARRGNDFFGEWVEKKISKQIDCNIKKGQGKTATTIALVLNEHRTFLNDPGENTKLCIQDLNTKKIFKTEHLHIGGYWFLDSLRKDLPKLIDKTRKNNIQTSLNIGWDPQGWSEQRKKNLLELTEKIDVFFLNEEEAKKLTGQNQLQNAIKKINSPLTVIHRGAKGCLVNNKKIKTNKVKVKNPVGAGDAFNAAFIKFSCDGLNPEQAAEKASNFASKQINNLNEYS